MSRAYGKRTPRGQEPVLEPGGPLDQAGRDAPDTEGVRAEEGIGPARDIPGGLNHLANPPVKVQPVPVPEHQWPFRRALLAHGVPPDGQAYDRDPRLAGGQEGRAKVTEPAPLQTPVPVYIVTGGDPGVIRSAWPRSVQCPASTTGVPIRVCGRNPNRVEVRMLNEDTATDIRFATELSAIAAGTGALLPWPANSYLVLETQDEIYAIGATGSGTPRLSIVEVFERPLEDR
jgi:hypothetical protein